MARLYGPGPTPPPPLISTADLAGLSTDDVDGSPVGELVGTLSEERTGLIRYLDVAVRSAAKHVLVPIGHARIDREAVPPRVRLRAATQEDLVSVPEYVEEETPLDSRYHERVMSVHGRLFYGSRYYAHPSFDHTRLYAGESPILGSAAATGRGLEPLSQLDGMRVARSAPDILGWTVRGAKGETVGTVQDLLIEVEARQARYLVVGLDDPDRPTLLPIGYVELNGEESYVRAAHLTRDDLTLLPAYEAPLTREQENRLHAALEGRLTGDRYFDRADFNAPKL